MRYSALSLTLLSWVAVVRSQNCQLQVPQNPLTAQGLATPYILTGCNQLDFANQGAFVEAAILDPATGNIQIYNPLVINAGMTPIGNGTGASSTGMGTTTGMPTSTGTNSGTSLAPSMTPSGMTTDMCTTTNMPMSTGSTDNCATSPPSMTPSGVSSSTASQAAPTMAPRQAPSAGFYIPPIVPTLPSNAIVGIWFGSNAASLTLTGDTGGCVNGVGNSVFGQFAYCNGQAWFNAAKSAVSQGLIKLPAPGTASNGQACPTTHDFRVVDQDQSDNVVTTYLMIGNNTLAQNTPDNNKANPNAMVLSNASDNALITQFIDPALGCTPYQNPCTTCPTGQTPTLATDELLANFFPPAGGPALVPLNDPMVLVNGQPSLQKVNLYRDGTGQPQADNQNASATTYCQQISQAGIFINDNQQLFTNAGSPAAAAANNLFTFLAMRFSASFGPAPGLGCTQLLNVANPVTLTMDGNGVVTAATINTQQLQQILAGLNGGATTGASSGSGSASASTAASSVSAGTTATGSSMSASPTGVLLHLTSSAVGSATQPPTMASILSGVPTGAVGSAAQAPSPSSIPSGVPTSAVGSATQVPTASSLPTCTAAVTVTVTVTVTPGSPAQTASSASTSTGYNEGYGEGYGGGYGWGGWGGWNGYHRKRSTSHVANRKRWKSRMTSFD